MFCMIQNDMDVCDCNAARTNDPEIKLQFGGFMARQTIAYRF